jgi:xanthine dehydrogenase accessory factor
MERPLELWDVVGRWRAEGRRFVMATVVQSRGFTPQKSGARMLIGSSETWGTIGGGAIEQEVIEKARALLEEGGSVVLERHLTRELGMCCGGEMSVFLEVVEAAPRLVVFGAGYIAKPLAAMAAACGFEVAVVDEREEWATAERFPMAQVHLGSPESFARSWRTEGGEMAVVATHDHALDQRLVQLLLARPLRFLGMIGSVPKQRKFALRLRARGFSDQQIARLRTPLGFDIGARTPEEIALSVVAELVAVRRGAAVREGWVPPVRSQAMEALETVEGTSSGGGDS